MAVFDFSGLQQKADQVLKNSDEAIRKWVDLALAPAKDVPIEYYDPNGNLVQMTVPNRAKLFNDLLVNIRTMLRKGFYVDATNGNDANDGSSITPFQTIDRALDLVPESGVGVIYLKSGQTHTLNKINYLRNKIIFILSWETNLEQDPNGIESTPVATSPVLIVPDDGTNLTGGFRLDNSALYIGGWNRSIVVEVGSSNVDVGGGFVSSEVPYGGFASVSTFGIAHSAVSKAYAYLSNVRFNQLRVTTFTVNSSSGLLFTTGYGTAIFNISQSTFLDSLGNILNVGNLIAGVVKDANGVPRNVLINEVI